MSFQDNLRRYREQSGINAKDFAAQLGIKYTTYAGYENQGREPKYDTLCRIAAALHVSIDALMDFTPDKAAYWIDNLRKRGYTVIDDGENVKIAIDNGTADLDYDTFVTIMNRIDEESDDLVSQVRDGIFELKLRQEILFLS